MFEGILSAIPEWCAVAVMVGAVVVPAVILAVRLVWGHTVDTRRWHWWIPTASRGFVVWLASGVIVADRTGPGTVETVCLWSVFAGFLAALLTLTVLRCMKTRIVEVRRLDEVIEEVEERIRITKERFFDDVTECFKDPGPMTAEDVRRTHLAALRVVNASKAELRRSENELNKLLNG